VLRIDDSVQHGGASGDVGERADDGSSTGATFTFELPRADRS
jgi:hypothetical protein